MGSSEEPIQVTVHVTGFKKFGGVEKNPTETIVTNLQEFLKQRGCDFPEGFTVKSFTALDVAGDAVPPFFNQIMQSHISDSSSTAKEQVIWLHFGVHGGAIRFAIEHQAANEATFFCPDEYGWMPQQLPVVPEDGTHNQKRQSTLPVEIIAKNLKEKGFDVAVSNDAGRFVCNYIYYYSLWFSEQKGHKSLFVHVPPFTRIDERTQMEFAASLLETLASLN